MNSIIEDAAINLGNKDFTLYDLPFEIKKLRKECKDLREDYEELEQRHNGAFQDFELLKQKYRELEIKNVTLQNRYQQVAGATTEAGRYRKALGEIEEIVNVPCVADALDDCKSCDMWCEHKDILNIINKAKGEELL